MRSRILATFNAWTPSRLIGGMVLIVLAVTVWFVTIGGEATEENPKYDQKANTSVDCSKLASSVGDNLVAERKAPTYRTREQWVHPDGSRPEETVYVVSKEIYEGWRVYQAFCYTCHAIDGIGQIDTSKVPGAYRAAPSLSKFICVGDKKAFVDRVLRGGQGMPPWRHNKLVNKHIDDIYFYLVAVMTEKITYSERNQRNPLLFGPQAKLNKD